MERLIRREMQMSKKNAKPYSEKIHIWGRISSITAIAALMLVPIAISAHYNAWPEAGKLFNAMKDVIPVYWISGIAEVFTYAPMLGAGGTYLSFVTGNITNLKLPCGLNAIDVYKRQVLIYKPFIAGIYTYKSQSVTALPL